MAKRIPKSVGEFITAIESEGLDYAITDYCNTDEIRPDDMVLAGAIDAYRAIRQAIVDRLGDYGFKDE